MEAINKDIITTRVFDFPREQVFRAWAEPGLLSQWWGPNGFTNTFDEFEFKPGGDWKFTMHSPDGKKFSNESRYVSIAEPESIVLDHVNWPNFRLTATFEDLGGKTGLTFHQAFANQADYEKLKPIATPANEENLDRLQSVLEKM